MSSWPRGSSTILAREIMRRELLRRMSPPGEADNHGGSLRRSDMKTEAEGEYFKKATGLPASGMVYPWGSIWGNYERCKIESGCGAVGIDLHRIKRCFCL